MLSFCEKENCPESADIIQKLLNHPRLQSYFAKKGYSSSNQTETEADGTLVPSKNLIMSQASFHFESTTQERHSL